jgi:ribosomal protein RSM22 (predicted rRNA methylase)
MQQPALLSDALAALLEGVPRKELTAAAKAISEGYRRGKPSHGIAMPLQALAYAVARMPATYAASSAVFARLAEVMPDLRPASLLDVGAGTGAASWAAVTQWPGLQTVAMLEPNPAVRDLARKLAEAHLIESSALAKAEFLSGNLDVGKSFLDLEVGADLVVASYVLAELPEDKAAAVANDLWQGTHSVLALIEPGTPQGFARIRAARAALIDAGAHVAAPCTHDNDCPMSGGDWCHFSQRLSRSRDHMLLKDANVPFEDERYSYVVVTRAKLASGARILARPLEAKPGLTFKLCNESGLRAQFVASRDKDEYRRVRKRGWGDLF